MTFMDEVKKAYVKVRKQIKECPRICELCGKKETIHDLILKWDNGMCMCDDCAFMYYYSLENNEI